MMEIVYTIIVVVALHGALQLNYVAIGSIVISVLQECICMYITYKTRSYRPMYNNNIIILSNFQHKTDARI